MYGSITYDTVFTSTDGNETYTASFPQFPISALTLYAVTVRSVVTVNSGMTIENYNNTAVNANVKYYRNDDFTSGPTGDFNNTVFGSNYSAPGLGPYTTQTFPPVNTINNNSIIVDSLDTNDGTLNNTPGGYFVGNGNIAVTYSSTTQPLISPSNVAINSSTLTDQIHFSWTYYYCNTGTLAADLLSFTAVRQGQDVQLGWNTTGEQAGRIYNLQVSTDGTTFSDYAAVPSTVINSDASYSYTYPIPSGATGKLYFRLRIADVIGPDHYSSVCIINLNSAGATGFSIFPNPPSDYINLILPGDNRSWQVDIIAADGHLVQRNAFANTSLPRINFTRKLASGAYFVRATNILSGDSHTGSFVIPQ